MHEQNELSQERRNLLIGAGAVIGMAAAGPALAGHEHHHHEMMKSKPVLEAALHCMNSSQLCLAHCLEQFKAGDTSMAECAQAVQESASMCGAFYQLQALNSSHIKKVAAACLAVCETCEKTCDEFADQHEVCKDCRDSCTDLIKELKQIV